MKVKLYGVPGSHPVRGAELMLDYKGIPYKRRDLLPVASRVLTRALGFKGNRVPALKIDGRRVQGTHDVTRELEAVKPEPPLFPAEPGARAAVEEAEAWSDPFQQVPRGIIWWALKREPALPSAERGPVDFCALRRFASICACVDIEPPSAGAQWWRPRT